MDTWYNDAENPGIYDNLEAFWKIIRISYLLGEIYDLNHFGW